MGERKILVCAFACLGEGNVKSPGGEGVLGWNLVKQLARFHRVSVLTHCDNRRAIEQRMEAEPVGGVQFHYLKLPAPVERLLRFPHGGVQVYAYLWQVRAHLAATRLHRLHLFHVFHHLTYANDWMASFCGSLLPVAFIRGPGGGANRTPKRFLGEYCFRDRLWERFRSLGQWLMRQDPFFRVGQHRARAILVCNREALERLPQEYRTKATVFPVVGVCCSDLARAAGAERLGTPFRVVSAGRLVHWKGFGLAIEAFKAFLSGDRTPVVGHKPELVIVGDGPELPGLQALVRRLGLEANVRFDGWLPHDQVLARMRSSDVFLYASLRDGGGAVVVEAMAAGLPVVCLDLGGPGMHVTDDCGIKVKAECREQAVRDLAEALARLYQDRECATGWARTRASARNATTTGTAWATACWRSTNTPWGSNSLELLPRRLPKPIVLQPDLYERRWQAFVIQFLTAGKRRQVYVFDLVGLCALSLWPYFRVRAGLGCFDGQRVNLGAGASRLPGWIHADLNPLRRPDVWMDARRPWPFKTGSIRGIATSHFLEHLFDEELGFVMKEARRVLMPGGFLRVSVPDLDKAIAEYLSQGRTCGDEPNTRAERFHEFCHWHGAHHQVFNFARIRKLLLGVGFVNVTQPPFPASAFLTEQETRETDRHPEESLFAECVKPTDD